MKPLERYQESRGTPERRTRAVFFDVDETLVKSAPTHIEAWREAADKTNNMFPSDPPIVVDEAFILNQRGVTNEDATSRAGIAPESPRGKALIELKKQAVVALAVRAEWFPDAAAILPQLVERGYIVGVVTSSQRRFIEAVFGQRPDIGSLNLLIVARESYDRGKPAPDPLLKACEMVSVAPEEAVYVGDATVDGLCAERAGARFVLYCPGPSAPEGAERFNRIKNHLDLWRYL